ncbi:MAG: hypothetical protein AVDCRST_MAG56-6237, partial [uncultured Cytophagales bacterium]
APGQKRNSVQSLFAKGRAGRVSDHPKIGSGVYAGAKCYHREKWQRQ